MISVPSKVVEQMVKLTRLVAATDIVGRVPEPLIDPLLRAEALARSIEKFLPPIATSASGVPLTRIRK